MYTKTSNHFLTFSLDKSDISILKMTAFASITTRKVKAILHDPYGQVGIARNALEYSVHGGYRYRRK